MPKVASSSSSSAKSARRSHHSVIARNEETGIQERITITQDTRERFKHVGQPRKVVKPIVRPLIKRILSPEYIAERDAAYEADLVYMRQVADIIAQKRRLEERLQNPPLLSRISAARPETPEPVEPEPEKVLPKFHKTKHTRRYTDYAKMVDAAAKSIDRLRVHWKKSYDRLEEELVPNGTLQLAHERTGSTLCQVDRFLLLWNKGVPTWTHKEWRYIKRDLKAIEAAMEERPDKGGKARKLDMGSKEDLWKIIDNVAKLKDIFTYLKL